MEQNKKIVAYIPTEEETTMMREKVFKMVDCPEGCTLEQKAYILTVLIEAFKEESGITEMHPGW